MLRKERRTLAAYLVGIFLLVALSCPLVYAQQKQNQHARVVEEFSFWIKDLKVDHQGDLNTLNISISYRYAGGIKATDYPDFRLLAKDIENFLATYPNEVDYWEVVNKRLTEMLLKKYSAVASVTSEIKADATKLVPYSRASRVTSERTNGNRK